MIRLLFVLLLCGFSLAQASTKLWVINKDHSEIQFKVEYLSLTEVSGRFKNFSGSVELNGQEIPEQISIKVDSASVDTGNSLRDGHLKANSFFQSQLHPFIVFQSQSIKAMGPGVFKAIGQLTIKNISRGFSIEFSLSGPVKDTWGYQNKFVKFKSKINRTDFNMKWNKTLEEQKYLVSDEVDFWGTFQVQPSTHKTPSSKHMIPDTKYVREREKLARGELNKNEPELELAQEVERIVRTQPTKNISPLPKSIPDNYRDNIWWWVSLWVIGLLGFFAVIIVSFYSKNYFAELFPQKYEENGTLGHISDLVVIFFVVIYSLSFWFLGWGVR
jgi:polyisoprenoid-binding protein YceI